MALVNLAASGLAGVLWYLWPQLGPWPLLLVLVGQIGRVRSSGQWLPRTRFDAPLLLFFVTALLAAILAYNPTLAWAKFWVIVAGLALYAALATTPEEVMLPRVGVIAPRRLLVGSLASLVALYFLFTNDWLRWQGKLPSLDPLLTWLAAWQPALPGHRLHPNVAGGLIAALLPLQAAALSGSRARGPLLALSGAGLLLSLSRGAWAALAISAAAWWAWTQGRRWLALRVNGRPTRPWLLAGLGMLLLALALLALGAGRGWFPLPTAVSGRLLIWRHSLDLASDYAFTGLGLDNFEMAYSSYVMLLHVGYQVHSHNLLLNVWLEQGLLGLAAFAWLLLALVRRPAAPSWWRPAALMAVGVILLHGQVDDAFYGSRGVLILFLPWALITAPARSATAPARGAAAPARVGAGWAAARPFVWAAVGLLAAVILLLPGTRARFQANLGALRQTRAELAAYTWPQWPLQDELRRSGAINLAPALAHFQAALALDATNVTANRRLGQIELSLGQYEAARRHLEAAYASAPDQRATVQLLGESYAIESQVDRAARLWRTIDLGQGQIALRTWWYDHIEQAGYAALLGQAANQSRR